MVTADDREKGHRPFFVPHFFPRRFVHIGSRFVSITDGQCLRGRISACFGLKMNISGTTLYVVIYTPRDDRVRIISARKANPRELKRYENRSNED